MRRYWPLLRKMVSLRDSIREPQHRRPASHWQTTGRQKRTCQTPNGPARPGRIGSTQAESTTPYVREDHCARSRFSFSAATKATSSLDCSRRAVDVKPASEATKTRPDHPDQEVASTRLAA